MVMLRGTCSHKVLKITLPESWVEGECHRVLRMWRKKYGDGTSLLSEDGNEIPEEWPVLVALDMYGSTWMVRQGEDTEQLSAEAAALYKEGDYAGAMALASKALRQRNCNGRLQLLATRGACAMMLGNHEQCAADCWQAALNAAEGPDRDLLLARCARAQLRLGDFDSAESTCKLVMETGSSSKGDGTDKATVAVSLATQVLEVARRCSEELRRAERQLSRSAFASAELAARAKSHFEAIWPAAIVCSAVEVRALASAAAWEAAVEALGDLERWREIPPKGAVKGSLDRPACCAALRALSYCGRLEEAASLADAWTKRQRVSVHWTAAAAADLRRLADIKRQADTAYSAREFETAASLYGAHDHPVFNANAAAAYFNLGNLAAARTACDAALKARPFYDKVRLRRARCLANLANASSSQLVLVEAALADYDYLLARHKNCTTGSSNLDHDNLRAEATKLRARFEARHPAVTVNESDAAFAAYNEYVRRFGAAHRACPPKRNKKHTVTEQCQETESCLDQLGLGKDASLDAVKRAYRRLALQLHPDKCSDADADDKFRRLHQAYQTILVSITPKPA